MSRQTISLDLPAGIADIPTLVTVLNDRLRTIAGMLPERSASSGTVAGGGPQMIVFSIPGTLGIQSSAAPLFSLPATRTVSRVVALLKQPPVGADLSIEIDVAGKKWMSLVVPEGKTTAAVPISASIAAGALVTVAITGVGLSFPGADLTIEIWLA